MVSGLNTIWVDGGYDGDPFMRWLMDFCRWIVQVVLRPQERKGFVLLPKRWVVERTYGKAQLVRQRGLLPRGDAKGDGGFPHERLRTRRVPPTQQRI
jgi:transposase